MVQDQKKRDIINMVSAVSNGSVAVLPNALEVEITQ